MHTTEQNHNLTSVFTMPLIKFVLLVALILLIINQNLLPAGFIIFILLIVELARLWSRFVLRDLEIKYNIFPDRLFPDEDTTLQIEFNNKKNIPVNLSWCQSLTPNLRIFQEEEKNEIVEQERAIIGHKLLGRFDKYRIRYKIVPAKRGYYKLPSLLIAGRDGLGLYEKTKSIDNPAIIVYPRIRPMADLQLNPSDLIGEQKDNRPLLPDPIRIVGLRDYTPDMPARLINWKASAHKDDLLAKTLEPSADLRICITVDAKSFCSPSFMADDFEEALSVAASLAFWAENSKIPFGLIVNGNQAERNCPVVIPVNSSPDQVSRALEALARLEDSFQGGLDDLVQMESKNFPWGTTIIVIAKGAPQTKLESKRNLIYYNISKED